MLKKDDVERLNVGANLASKWYITSLMLLVALMFVAASAGQVVVALKYAHHEGVPFSEVLSLYWGNVEVGQMYSGRMVHAIGALSTALWNLFEGLFFIVLAASLRRRGQFYERLRRALNVRNA